MAENLKIIPLTIDDKGSQNKIAAIACMLANPNILLLLVFCNFQFTVKSTFFQNGDAWRIRVAN